MRALLLGLLPLAAWACSSSGDYIAVESVDDADLRVVIARTDKTAEIKILPLNEPYRFAVEPLKQVFDRGAVLKVWVLPFRSRDLAAEYPALAGKSLAEMMSVLAPELGEPGPGRYQPPAPLKALAAIIESGSAGPVEYEAQSWDAIKDTADLRFGFALPATLACAPVGVPVRVFAREDPSAVCVYTRDERCVLTRSGVCANDQSVFGESIAADRTVRQLPTGALLLPSGSACTPIEARSSGAVLGETRAWKCGSKEIGAQDPPLDNMIGSVLMPVTVDRVDITSATAITQGESGAFMMLAGKPFRLGISNGDDKVEPLVNLEVDHYTMPRTLVRDDALHAHLMSGTFDSNVDPSLGQCLRAFDSTLHPITTLDGGHTMLGVGSPLPGFITTTFWTILGLPRSGSAETPDLLLPNIGTIRRLSHGTGDTLYAHGSGLSYKADPIRRFNSFAHYACAAPVRKPTGLLSDIVAGRDGYFGLVSAGLVHVTSSGTSTTALDGITVTGAETIQTFLEGASDRVVIIPPGGRSLTVVDASSAAQSTRSLGGPLLALIDGPLRAVYLPDGAKAELRVIELSNGREVKILVPPYEESSPGAIEMSTAGALVKNGHSRAGYAAGRYAGTIDLDSGVSRAIELGANAAAPVAFVEDSNSEGRIWALLTSDTQRLAVMAP